MKRATTAILLAAVAVGAASCEEEDGFVEPSRGATGSGAEAGASLDGGSSTPPNKDASNGAYPDSSSLSPPPTDDAAPDAPPADPCAGRLVCEDFEGTALGAAPGAPFSVQKSKGTVAVDGTRAHSGTRSLKVTIDATTSSDTYRQAYLAVTGAPLVPLTNNSVYGRFMIWTDRIPASSVHWTIASGSGPRGSEYAVYNYGGMGNLMANYYRNTSPDPTDCWQTKDEPFPTGKWTCVAFQLDGTANEMRYWQDGVEISELHVLGNNKTDQTCTVPGVDGRWLAPTFDAVRVGWESYQHDSVGAHEAWIDDLILDDQPIACPQ